MENNPKQAILSFKKNIYIYIFSFFGYDPQTQLITNLLKRGRSPFFKRFVSSLSLTRSTFQPPPPHPQNVKIDRFLGFTKKTYIELFRSWPTYPIDHKWLEKGPKALFQEILWLKLNPINVSTPHPKMLKLTVFQGSPSLTKQPNWALMENNT